MDAGLLAARQPAAICRQPVSACGATATRTKSNQQESSSIGPSRRPSDGRYLTTSTSGEEGARWDALQLILVSVRLQEYCIHPNLGSGKTLRQRLNSASALSYSSRSLWAIYCRAENSSLPILCSRSSFRPRRRPFLPAGWHLTTALAVKSHAQQNVPQ